MIIVLNQFLPLALSRLTLGRLLKKVNKPARNLPVPAKGSSRSITIQALVTRAIANQANIGTVSKATLGKLVRDGMERIWALQSA